MTHQIEPHSKSANPLPALTTIGIAAATVTLLSIAALREHRASLEAAEYATPPQDMVLVPAGHFLYGTNDPDAGDDERPQRSIFLPAFYIDTYEVNNAQYQQFDPNHTFPPGEENHPVTGVLLADARAYADSSGKRLPTRAEWEKAARGTDGRDFTWGNEFQYGIANMNAGPALTEVGQFPESISPYGAHDMIGNAWEWVDDLYTDGGLLRTGGSSQQREVIKGGAFSYSPYQCRISYNGFEGLGGTCNDVGFRCAKDANPST